MNTNLFKYLGILSVVILISTATTAQDFTAEKPGYFVFGIGGQSMVSIHYEGVVIDSSFAKLSVRAGGGLNQNGDQEYGDYPVYCLIPEVIGAFGKGLIQVEAGLSPTVYFHEGTSFVNINGLVGIRVGNSMSHDFYASLDYTPRLHTSSTNQAIEYIGIGLRVGVRIK